MTDRIIETWYLVDLKVDEECVGQVLWGIVVNDRKSRWVSGNFVCTSPVVECLHKGLYRTRNSEHQCQGDGQKVALPVEALIELPTGYSLDEYLAQKAPREQGFEVL